MLDRSKTGQRKMVLQTLLDALSPDVQSQIGARLEDAFNSAVSAARALRCHRNKRIAHQDLDTLLGGLQLEGITCVEIRQTLEHIEAFLGAIYSYFVPNTRFVWDFPDICGGSDSLLSRLRLVENYPQIQRRT
jgi:hypothetical protein